MMFAAGLQSDSRSPRAVQLCSQVHEYVSVHITVSPIISLAFCIHDGLALTRVQNVTMRFCCIAALLPADNG